MKLTENVSEPIGCNEDSFTRKVDSYVLKKLEKLQMT